MMPTKVENVQIKMTLDKAAHDRHAQVVKDLAPHLGPVLENDTLNLTYTFHCLYFGDIVKKLTAVQELCSDPQIIHEASCRELRDGKILVYEVLKKLDDVICTLAEPDDPFPWRRNRDPEPEPRPKRRSWREWWRGE